MDQLKPSTGGQLLNAWYDQINLLTLLTGDRHKSILYQDQGVAVCCAWGRPPGSVLELQAAAL